MRQSEALGWRAGLFYELCDGFQFNGNLVFALQALGLPVRTFREGKRNEHSGLFPLTQEDTYERVDLGATDCVLPLLLNRPTIRQPSVQAHVSAQRLGWAVGELATYP